MILEIKDLSCSVTLWMLVFRDRISRMKVVCPYIYIYVCEDLGHVLISIQKYLLTLQMR